MDCLFAEEAVLHNILPAGDGLEASTFEDTTTLKKTTAMELGQRGQREVHLHVQVETLHGETVLVSGSTPEMGEWQVSRALPLVLEDPATKVWGARVRVPIHKTVEFRYLVGIILEPNTIIVRRWETVMHPRAICANELTVDRNAVVDIFANYDGEDKVEPGWLTSESIVQLKLFNSPIVFWKKKYQMLPLSYRITPIDITQKSAEGAPLCEDSDQQSNVSDFECIKWPVIEIAVMKEGECEFKHQNQFGNIYHPEDFVVFQAQVLDPPTIGVFIGGSGL